MKTFDSARTSKSMERSGAAVRWCGKLSMIGLTFLVVGCGRPNTTSTTSTSGPIDACALITVDEVAAVLGTAVSPPHNEVIGAGAEGMAAVSQCIFASATEPAKSVSVFVRRSPVADYTPESIRTSLSEFGATFEDVAGVGDAAMWDGSQLHVFVGQNDYAIISIAGLSDKAELLTKTKRVGETVATRLR